MISEIADEETHKPIKPPPQEAGATIACVAFKTDTGGSATTREPLCRARRTEAKCIASPGTAALVATRWGALAARRPDRALPESMADPGARRWMARLLP